MNGDIGIFMGGFHKNIPYGNGDAQFFLTLPNQCFGAGFAGLHFAAGKFPQQAQGFGGGALANEKAVFPPDQGSDNLGHGTLSFG